MITKKEKKAVDTFSALRMERCQDVKCVVPRVGVAKSCVWKCLWEVLFSENIKNDNIVYLYCDFGVNQYLLL